MNEREEIELLLPWYVTGKLDTDDHRRVEAYLVEHRDLDDQLALVREDQEAVIALNEQVPTPSGANFDRLLTQIDIEEPTNEPQRVSFLEGLKSLFGAYGSPGLKLAAASLVVLLVAQSLAITSMLSGNAPETTYQTASGPQAASKPDLLIGFAPEATALQIQNVLEEIDGEIIGGPMPGGMFEVRLSQEKKTDGQLEQIQSQLRLKTGIIRQIMEAN